jgi:hypothetical protein
MTSLDSTRRIRFLMGRAKRPRTIRCQCCRKSFKVPIRGRLPNYCSASCRQRAYQKRKWRGEGPFAVLAEDLAHIRVREWLRKEIWSLLVQAGLAAPHSPVPPIAPRRSRAKLKLVPPAQPPGDGAADTVSSE